jgi:hypothetical protein
VGLGLTDLTGVFERDEVCLSGHEHDSGGNPLVVTAMAAAVLQSWRGWMVRAWLALRAISGGLKLTGPERRRLQRVERATSALVALASFMKPRISLIDGFEAMEGEGPRYGQRVKLGTVVAGTDPVAVDAVAASIMGFEPQEIAYLRQAEFIGMGRADLSSITVVGDPVWASRRRCRRHSADSLLRLVSCPAAKGAGLPGPHFGLVRTPGLSERLTGAE